MNFSCVGFSTRHAGCPALPALGTSRLRKCARTFQIQCVFRVRLSALVFSSIASSASAVDIDRKPSQRSPIEDKLLERRRSIPSIGVYGGGGRRGDRSVFSGLVGTGGFSGLCETNRLWPWKSFEKTKAPSMSDAQSNGVGTELVLAMSATQSGDPRAKDIADSIRAIPDFPKPGILFRDVTTLLLNPKAFQDCIDMFVERYRGANIDVIAGIEARGFIFGPPIALALGAKFVPVRKAKKLPGEVIGEEYTLEYGIDKIEIHVGAVNPGDRVVLIDDLVATGGTLAAALRLMERVDATVVECGCVIELPELKGRLKLNGKPLFVLVEFEGH